MCLHLALRLLHATFRQINRLRCVSHDESLVSQICCINSRSFHAVVESKAADVHTLDVGLVQEGGQSAHVDGGFAEGRPEGRQRFESLIFAFLDELIELADV
jgi:hypothetical protein